MVRTYAASTAALSVFRRLDCAETSCSGPVRRSRRGALRRRSRRPGGGLVGTSVRVNTINQVGTSHKVYINGSLKQTISSPSGSYYDKFGTYRTASGAGPINVTWSGIKFWHK